MEWAFRGLLLGQDFLCWKGQGASCGFCYQIYILFMNIESPPSMHPPLRICDITGFEVRVSVEMCLVLELADEIDHYF